MKDMLHRRKERSDERREGCIDLASVMICDELI